MLSLVNKLYSSLVLRDDSVPSRGFGCYIVSTRVGDLYVQVDKASCAPTKVIFGKVKSYAITDDVLVLPLLNEVNLVIEGHIQRDGIVWIL